MARQVDLFEDIEVFYLVEIEGADRRYIWHSSSPEYREKLRDQGARVYRVTVPIPSAPVEAQALQGSAQCD